MLQQILLARRGFVSQYYLNSARGGGGGRGRGRGVSLLLALSKRGARPGRTTSSSCYFSSTAVEESSSSSSSSSSLEEDGGLLGLYRLLTPQERKWLVEQRQLTDTSRTIASQVGFGSLDNGGEKNINNPLRSFLVDELNLQASFSVVVAGEFNAGKSTLINALLGTKLLESGALPTTDAITIIAAADNNNNDDDDDNDNNNTGTDMDTDTNASTTTDNTPKVPLGVILHSVGDLPLLQDLTLVDTPGTNSAWMDHTERTLRLLPTADLILFVTSADRPFSDSERTLLKSIQAYRKSIVVVINKMDILDVAGGDHGQEQKQAIVEFVTDHASELLGARPIVLPVSARDALSAKLMEKTTNVNNNASTTATTTGSSSTSSPAGEQQRSNVWHRSNFGALESFLKDSLTTQAKLKSKLTSPIGVAEGVMSQSLATLKEQRTELQTDIATLNILRTQFVGWKKELSSDMDHSRRHMTDMVRQEGQRCEILLGRMNAYNFHVWTLLDTPRLEQEWEETKRQASAHRQKDIEADLLEQVQETADSIATRGRAQGQAVIEYLGKRPAMKNQSLVGSVTAASRFEDTRKLLVERMSSAVYDSLKSNDEAVEAARLFRSLRQTALISASFQTGALGSAMSVATHLVDPIPGLAALSSFAIGGGAWYLAGTLRMGQKYQAEWSNRAQVLDDALDAISSRELERVNRRILDGVAPYTRFVESEQERIARLQEQCEGVCLAARNLRNRIGKLG